MTHPDGRFQPKVDPHCLQRGHNNSGSRRITQAIKEKAPTGFGGASSLQGLKRETAPRAATFTLGRS
jgi:hypothetical protein